MVMCLYVGLGLATSVLADVSGLQEEVLVQGSGFLSSYTERLGSLEHSTRKLRDLLKVHLDTNQQIMARAAAAYASEGNDHRCEQPASICCEFEKSEDNELEDGCQACYNDRRGEGCPAFGKVEGGKLVSTKTFASDCMIEGAQMRWCRWDRDGKEVF